MTRPGRNPNPLALTRGELIAALGVGLGVEDVSVRWRISFHEIAMMLSRSPEWEGHRRVALRYADAAA